MTPGQRGRYWGEWGQIRKLLTEQGEFSAEDADLERKEIHRKALKRDKSSKDLTTRDLDKIFDEFAKYLVFLHGPKARDKGPSQACKRLIWAIEQLGLAEAYLVKICRDQFKTDDWRSLPEADLTKFRFTATARASKKRE